MAKIGITGGAGFVGWHLRCLLRTADDFSDVRIAELDVFSSPDRIRKFVTGLDLIVHLAGVNRAEDAVLIEGNLAPARDLVAALEQTGCTPTLMFSSSVQALHPQNVYGESKAAVTCIFREWAARNNARFVNLFVPHVFGEYGKPHYNSAVATFAHQVAHGEAPSITGDGQLELIHVQDLAEQILALYADGTAGDVRIEGRPTGVVEVAERLKALFQCYIGKGQFPGLSDHFDRCLFNTLRGALPVEQRMRGAQKHQDERGWLVETVKANSGGQCFVSTTRPGITRGNHFHRRKVERFFVLQGQAEIAMRKLFTAEVQSYHLDGSAPAFVDIPTLFTHNITNTGREELITLFWADEFFDPDRPDTTFEEVAT